MLVFDFVRDRKTKSCTLVSLKECTPDLETRYSFKSGTYPATISEVLLPCILGALHDLPYETRLYNLPDFSFKIKGLCLGRAKVFQSTSSIADAKIQFHAAISSGSSAALFQPVGHEPLPRMRSSVSSLVDLLLDTIIQVLNVNVLQVRRLEGHLDREEQKLIEEQHARLVTMATCAARVANRSETTNAGLEHALSRLSLMQFKVETLEAIRLKGSEFVSTR